MTDTGPNLPVQRQGGEGPESALCGRWATTRLWVKMPVPVIPRFLQEIAACVFFWPSIGSVPPFGTGNRSSLQEPRVTRFRGGREGRLLWPIASHFGPGPIRGSSPVGTQAATASGRLIKRGKSCSTENRMLQLYAKTCTTSVRVTLQSSMSRTPSKTLLEKWSRQYSPH